MREDIVARGGSSKAEGVHFGLFVGVALGGMAEAVVEAAGLFANAQTRLLPAGRSAAGV